VYAAEHLSLAALELFVHLDPEDAPRAMFRFRVEVPDDAIELLPAASLPRTWRHYPAPPGTATVGSEWARRGEHLALVVPSAIIPEERNVLLNPEHPRFAQLDLGKGEAFSFDPRMWKTSRAGGG
jgi:RES domain-containing protein